LIPTETPDPYFLVSWASSSLHEGAQTAWALPSTFLVPIIDRGRCFPHKKHDIVALPKEVVATKGEPETLDLYLRPSGRTAVLVSVLATGFTFTHALYAVQDMPERPPALADACTAIPKLWSVRKSRLGGVGLLPDRPRPKTLYFNRIRQTQSAWK
jgi:hypothetical protein